MAVLEKITCPPPIEKVPDEPKEDAAQSIPSAEATAKTSKKSKVKKKKVSLKDSKAVEGKETPPCSEKVARVAALIGQTLAQDGVAKDSAGSQDAYKPGEFNEIYQKFLKEKKKEGHKHRDAILLWKSSVTRERLLFGMSESQRKKRRFD